MVIRSNGESPKGRMGIVAHRLYLPNFLKRQAGRITLEKIPRRMQPSFPNFLHSAAIRYQPVYFLAGTQAIENQAVSKGPLVQYPFGPFRAMAGGYHSPTIGSSTRFERRRQCRCISVCGCSY